MSSQAGGQVCVGSDILTQATLLHPGPPQPQSPYPGSAVSAGSTLLSISERISSLMLSIRSRVAEHVDLVL